MWLEKNSPKCAGVRLRVEGKVVQIWAIGREIMPFVPPLSAYIVMTDRVVDVVGGRIE